MFTNHLICFSGFFLYVNVLNFEEFYAISGENIRLEGIAVIEKIFHGFSCLVKFSLMSVE